MTESSYQKVLIREHVDHSMLYIKKYNTLIYLSKLINAINLISTELATRLAYKLYFQVVNFSSTENENNCLLDSQETKINFKGNQYTIFSWGEGPAILFIHGRNGRGTQFYAFISPLKQLGYKVIFMDFPAHGKNKGSSTDIPECSAYLQHVTNELNIDIHTIVAHCLGANWVFHALGQGLTVSKLVCISPIASCVNMLIKFQNMLDLPTKLIDKMKDKLEKNYGKTVWLDFSIFSILERLKDKPTGLVIHDTEDQEVPIQEAIMLSESWSVELFKTTQLGHRKILKSEMVIKKICKFINE